MVDWSRLSPEGSWRLLNLGLPLSYGTSERELAGLVGESPDWVATQLEALRAELIRARVTL